MQKLHATSDANGGHAIFQLLLNYYLSAVFIWQSASEMGIVPLFMQPPKYCFLILKITNQLFRLQLL